MKLELKYLAPYLPYNLNCMYVDDEFNGVDVILSASSITSILAYQAKPLLRPLSDYTDIGSIAFSDLNCDLHDQIIINELANKFISLGEVTYRVIKIMAENHIDFFRLIDEGLAIDINIL